jgi:hypothetical protein
LKRASVSRLIVSNHDSDLVRHRRDYTAVSREVVSLQSSAVSRQSSVVCRQSVIRALPVGGRRRYSKSKVMRYQLIVEFQGEESIGRVFIWGKCAACPQSVILGN